MSTDQPGASGALINDLLSRVGNLRPQAAEVEGTSGGGAVRVKLRGLHELASIEISPEVASDVELLQELIVAAVNSALAEAKAATESAAFGLLEQLGRG